MLHDSRKYQSKKPLIRRGILEKLPHAGRSPSHLEPCRRLPWLKLAAFAAASLHTIMDVLVLATGTIRAIGADGSNRFDYLLFTD